MRENLFLVASQVGTLFLMMAVGFVLARLGKLTRDNLPRMTFLLLYVVIPCLIVNTLQTECSPEVLRSMGAAALVTAGLYAVYCLLILPFFRRQPPDTRAPLQFGVVYGNVGFMGIPLIRAVLGTPGMLYVTVIFIVFNAYNWSHGILLMGGRRRFSLKRAVLNPGILATAVGLPLFLLGIRLPPVVGSAVSFLGDMNTPLAMIVIGAQMAFADLRATFRDRRLYLAAFLKLAAMPALTLLVLYPLGLDPVLYSALIILAATPTGGTASMFAQQFERDAVAGAQVVTLTTLFSILTLPAVALLAKLAGGA